MLGATLRPVWPGELTQTRSLRSHESPRAQVRRSDPSNQRDPQEREPVGGRRQPVDDQAGGARETGLPADVPRGDA